jgi:hypothetical protein
MRDNPVVQVRLSPTDYRHLTRLAESKGVSLAQTIRNLIRSASK